MRAVTISDEALIVEEHPDPEPGKGELLIRVRAAGINGADIHQRGGRYPAPPGSPQDIPGLEFAGDVEKVGPGVLRFKEGDRVMAVVRGGPVAELGAEAIDPEGFERLGPFDVVLELVGAPNLATNVGALATLGRIVVIGIGAGAKAELNLAALMGVRGTVRASTLRARPPEEKAIASRLVERHVLPLVERGEVTVPVADTYPLERAEEAYDRFTAGGKLGKVVLLNES